MKIFIPSYGRADQQITLKYLGKRWLKHTSFVVYPEDAKDYYETAEEFGVEVDVLPEGVRGISAKRQWIFENKRFKYLCFLDDDLNFHIRNKQLKLRRCRPFDFNLLMGVWLEWLESGEYALVGVSTRGGNNRVTEDFAENTRIMSAYAFNRNVLIKHGVRFDRLPFMQDFDITLQLLEAGHKNCVSYKFAHDQAKGSQALGGCSVYRTSEKLRFAANKLLSLHPRVVKVVAKKSKSAWKTGMEKKSGIKGTIRTDVNIQWKKAYAGKPKLRKKGILDRIK